MGRRRRVSALRDVIGAEYVPRSCRISRATSSSCRDDFRFIIVTVG
jgi:hypothetical protein